MGEAKIMFVHIDNGRGVGEREKKDQARGGVNGYNKIF